MESIIKKPVDISSENNINEKLMFKTSANFLCNFMKKPEYLRWIIRDMAIKPRYVEERIDYLGIPEWTTLTFPMTCFCDIPLIKVASHNEEYGDFGIALNKNYCISKDVQPIMYLNKNSRLKKDFAEVLSKLHSSDELPDEYKIYPNMMLGLLLYTKPIEGNMKHGDDQLKHRNFKDECEWRYIPSVPDDMPLIMNPIDNTEKGRDKYSEALAGDESTWFKFEIDNIEYIIVPGEQEALDLITAINRMKRKTLRDKQRLISKIEVGHKIPENYI